MQIPSDDILKISRLLQKLDEVYQEYKLSSSGWVEFESGTSVYVTFDEHTDRHGIEVKI